MIPFLDLKAQHTEIRDEIDRAISGVIDNNQFILGKEVNLFEEEFADYCGAEHCIAVNCGTSALHLALLSIGVQSGDEVITTPMTFVATVAAIVYAGAKPVFVDIDPSSYTLDPNSIEEKISSKTKAIIPVHLYGQPADMDPIMEIAKKYNLKVIEDACQAHGAGYRGTSAGSIGDIGCFSFYPGKNLGAFGEGGALITSNSKYAEDAKMMRDWGQKEKYKHIINGFNYRMDGIQGAVLRVKLRQLDKWNQARAKHADLYTKILSGMGYDTPEVMSYCNKHVFHIYPILLPNRDEMIKHLNNKNIQTGIHYPYPVHLLEAYKHLGFSKGDFPIAESVSQRELSLPMFPQLTEQQIRDVCQAVSEI